MGMTIKYYTLWFFNYNHTVVNIYGKWRNMALQGPPWQSRPSLAARLCHRAAPIIARKDADKGAPASHQTVESST